MDYMDPSSCTSAFAEIKQRINEIKRKNNILCRQYGTFKWTDFYLQDIKRQAYESSNILDEMEVSAVENCYKRATNLAEYYLRRRKERKQKKLKSINNVAEIKVKKRKVSMCLNGKKKRIISDGNDDSLFHFRNKNKQFQRVFLDWDTSKNSGLKNVSDSSNILNSSKTTLINNSNTSDHFHNTSCLCDKKETSMPQDEDLKMLSVNETKLNYKIKKLKSSHILSESNQIPSKKVKFFKPNENSDVAILKTINSPNKLTTTSDENYLQNCNCVGNSSVKICNSDKAYMPKKLYENSQCRAVQNKAVTGARLFTPNNFKEPKLNKLKHNLKKKLVKPMMKGPVEEIMLKHKREKESVKVITPVLDLTDEPLEEMILVQDLSKPSKAIPEFDLTEEPFEEMMLEQDLSKPAKAIPEFDLTEEPADKVGHYLVKEHAKAIIPELDLTEDAVKEIIPEINLSDDLIGVDLSKLDLTEEPVDFPIPRLHLIETLNYMSKEKIESLKSRGLIIRDGKWSKKEVALLRRNFMDFKSQFHFHDTNMLLGIGRHLHFYKYENRIVKKFLKAKHFYIRLGKDINERTLRFIYYRAIIAFNTFKRNKDVTSNDIAAVIELQKKYGNNWNLIGKKLGIFSNNCRKIYENNKKPLNKGKWSETEINDLISAIKSVAKTSKLNVENVSKISWNKVSDLVPTRNTEQCAYAWYYTQSRLFGNVSYVKWNVSHTAKLIMILKNKYQFANEWDIPWKEIKNSFKDVAHFDKVLNRRWSTIKKCVPEKYRENFSEMIKFCYEKYSKYIKRLHQENA